MSFLEGCWWSKDHVLVGNKSLMLSSPTLHTLEAMSHRRVKIWETLLLQQIVRIYILSIIQSEDYVHMYTVKRKAMIFAKVQSKKVSTESDTNYMTELGTFLFTNSGLPELRAPQKCRTHQQVTDRRDFQSKT